MFAQSNDAPVGRRYSFFEAVRRRAPLPFGTVITSVRYAAQLDASGNLAKDANGRFIKNKILRYTGRKSGPAGAPNISRQRGTASGSIGSSARTKPPTRTPSTVVASAVTSRRRTRVSAAKEKLVRVLFACLFVFEPSTAEHGRDVTWRANRRHESVFGKDRIKRDWRMNHFQVGLGRQHQNL
jgi:hypothetical protein